MKNATPEREDLHAIVARLRELIEAARGVTNVDSQTLEELQFHLDCSLIAGVRLKAEQQLKYGQRYAHH